MERSPHRQHKHVVWKYYRNKEISQGNKSGTGISADYMTVAYEYEIQ